MGEVDREAFRAAMARAVDGCDPHAGLHGPTSTSWRVSRESVLFLGGGCAALLQLAHPYVAHAVAEHSRTQADPIGRFTRTFQHVYAMVFGTLGAASSSARGVRRIHERVLGELDERVGAFPKGHRYAANDAGALLWVHATLVHTAIRVYELVVTPLSNLEKATYWLESKRFARMFGVPDAVLPPTWPAFLRYWERTLDSRTIAVGTHARAIGSFLMTPPNPMTTPFVLWYRRMTAGLLPPRLQVAFELPFSPRDQLLFRASLATLRAVYPRLPRRLRDVPAYNEAMARLAGRERPDRVGRALERMVLRTLTPA